MKFKRPIYRILFFAAWIVVLGGLATLVIAANRKTGLRKCKGVAISINGDGKTVYVKKEDVLKTIERTAKGPVMNKSFDNMNLGAMEMALEANAWIRDAELYLDTKDVLHVSVSEREPFARVFTTGGASYYIDSSGYQLPLLDAYTVKLPVVTGFTAAKKWSRKDSATMQGLKRLILAVGKDSFWRAQVGQIDITPDRKFEAIPLIGSHVIKLGYAENVDEKLKNLLVFYKQVLPKAGLAKYSALDVQFDGQVVAIKKGPASAIDSVQLQKNIEELMKKKEAEQEPEDALPAIPWITTPQASGDSATADPPLEPPVNNKTKTPAGPAKKFTGRKASAAKNEVQKPSKQIIKNETPKPKAVMPPKGRNEY